MQGAERVVKRSCKLCTSESRDEIEEQLLNGHISPKEYTENQFADYFKFAFVRNPWDLVVSRYHWNRKGRQTC